jgi:hypothetical protein
MSAVDFLQLPTGVKIVFIVMLWPAIWAGGLLVVALAGDVRRRTEHHASRIGGGVAVRG